MVVVIDTNEMLHHKWAGMVSGGSTVSGNAVTTYYTYLRQKTLSSYRVLCGAFIALRRSARLRLVVAPWTLDKSSSEC